MSERNQNEDEMVLSVGAGYKQPIQPHMEFEYQDPDIQQDLYQIMKYSCGEICAPEQRDKVLKVWTTFVEPVLGVRSRPPNAENKEDIINTFHGMAESPKNVGEGNSSPADATAYCKKSDKPGNRDGHIPTVHSRSGSMTFIHGNYGVSNNGSFGADNVASKSECNTPHNGLQQTDANMISAKPCASKQAGPCTEGEQNINEENPSATWKGPEFAGADCGIEVRPNQESQDGVIPKPTSSLIATMPEEVKAQNYHEETEAGSKGEREEGELSPNRNLEDPNFAAFANSGTKAEQIACESNPNTKRIGGEICTVEAGEETDANNADVEGEGSVHGSSDSENASENGDMSASESANGEDCSPGEPDDGDHDENVIKVESEREADGMADVQDNEGTMPFSDRFLHTVKPLTMEVPMALRGKEKDSQIFYGNDSFYLLFRLHQILYERMQSAKMHSSSPENKWRILNDANPIDSYARFKDALHSFLLNGSSDNTKFEDECRAIIGAQSYILFTLDKLIHKLVKQLQTIATDEMDNKLLQLYAYEKSRNPETFADAIYHENARFLLPDDNLYRIECLPCPMRVTIQLMKNDHDKLEPTAVSMDPKFAAYLNDELLAVAPERKGHSGVFLKRNKRKSSTGDEFADTYKAMEGLIIHNGVEMKLHVNMKIGYVLDTEDFLYRTKKMRRVLYHGESSSGGTSNGTFNGFSQIAKRRRSMFSYDQFFRHRGGR